MSLLPENFPTVRMYARSQRRFDEAIDFLAASLRAGSVRKLDLNCAQLTLGNAVDEGWCRVCSQFFNRGMPQSEDVAKLYWCLNVTNVHELTAAKRKLDATRATGAAVDAMRAYVNECFPIADAMVLLKLLVVRGRATRAEPVTVNPRPRRLQKTCTDSEPEVLAKGQKDEKGQAQQRTQGEDAAEEVELETTFEGPRP